MEKKVIDVLEYVLTLCPSYSEKGYDIQKQCQEALYQYVINYITYEMAHIITTTLLGDTFPVDKVKAILSVPPIPIPEPDLTILKGTRKSTRVWSSYEDERLLSAIIKFGLDNWTMVSRFVGNDRNRSQCSQRWLRGLDPHLSKNHWTKSEESLLMQLVTSHGDKNWTKISTMMGNRSDIQCRYHYKQIMKEKDDNIIQKKEELSMARYAQIIKLYNQSISSNKKTSLAKNLIDAKYKENCFGYSSPDFTPEKMSISSSSSESVIKVHHQNKMNKKHDEINDDTKNETCAKVYNEICNEINNEVGNVNNDDKHDVAHGEITHGKQNETNCETEYNRLNGDYEESNNNERSFENNRKQNNIFVKDFDLETIEAKDLFPNESTLIYASDYDYNQQDDKKTFFTSLRADSIPKISIPQFDASIFSIY